MSERAVDGMRSYWNDRARTNAAWYVDTSLNYEQPEMEKFWETGKVIVGEALDGDVPVVPEGHGLAVEIGPGLGRICKALADRFDDVIGVDISEEMVRQAQESVQHEHVKFVVGDGASLTGVADGSADLVLSFTVFQHISDASVTEQYIREAGRVLKPGGVMVFQWNNEPGARRWRIRRAVLSTLQHRGIKPERWQRHDPAFMGTKVPLTRITRALTDAHLELRGTRGEGTLYAWAWAKRT